MLSLLHLQISRPLAPRYPERPASISRLMALLCALTVLASASLAPAQLGGQGGLGGLGGSSNLGQNGGRGLGGSGFSGSNSLGGLGGSGGQFGRNSSRSGNGLNQSSLGGQQGSARRQSRRSNRKQDASSTTTTAVQGAPARAAAQARSTPVAQNQSGNAQGKGKGKGKAAIELPKFKQSPDILSDTLYFSPSEIKVVPGERFSTPLFFFNTKMRALDEVDVWIHYDPELVEPGWINIDPIKGAAESGLVRDAHLEAGYVHIQADFKEPLKQLVQPLATIIWRALDTAAPTQLTLETPEGGEMGVWSDGQNCLDLSALGNDGLVTVPVRIVDEKAFHENDLPYRILSPGENPRSPEARREKGVRLALVPRGDTVPTGAVSTLDVALINPGAAEFDEIRFRVRFNPAAVEILDADEDNYITRGTNIYDGGFHDRMPFDTHLDNAVDQSAGVIEYAALNRGGPRAYPSGTVARVVFRMKKDAGVVPFWFEAIDPATGRLASDVRDQGRSLMGDADEDPVRALHNAAVAAKPAELANFPSPTRDQPTP